MTTPHYLTRSDVESFQRCGLVAIPTTIFALVEMLRNEVAYHNDGRATDIGPPCQCPPCIWLRAFDAAPPLRQTGESLPSEGVEA